MPRYMVRKTVCETKKREVTYEIEIVADNEDDALDTADLIDESEWDEIDRDEIFPWRFDKQHYSDPVLVPDTPEHHGLKQDELL